MALLNLEFHGIHIAEPEEFFCAVFRVPTSGKIIPVWMSPVEGGRVAARHQGYSARRPDTHDLLITSLEAQGGVQQLLISSVYEGVFMADIVLNNGETLDAKLSDVLILAEHFKVPVEIEEDLAQSVSIYASQDDLLEYLDLDLPTPVNPAEAGEDFEGLDSVSASGDAQADADFSEMMRSLGMSEEDFLGDAEEDVTDDTDVKGDEER